MHGFKILLGVDSMATRRLAVMPILLRYKLAYMKLRLTNKPYIIIMNPAALI